MQRANLAGITAVMCLAGMMVGGCGGDSNDAVADGAAGAQADAAAGGDARGGRGGQSGGQGGSGAMAGGQGGSGAMAGGQGGNGGVCPAIACAPLPCASGMTSVDANGCNTCKCDPLPTCGPGACGPQNFVVAPCPDGKARTPVCSPGAADVCQWVIPECAPACPAIKCATECSGGYLKDARGCQTCKCAPAPVCTPDKCGPLPPVAPCPNGMGPAISCDATSAGKCQWSVGTCQATCKPMQCLRACPFGSKTDANGCDTCDCLPETCAPEECGPGPKLPSRMCADGTVAGPVCKRDKGGVCGWTITECPLPPPCGGSTDAKSCGATMGCRWLQPGCSDPALQTAGCYPTAEIGCDADTDCAGGRQCLKRVVDPCFAPNSAVTCAACGQTITVCL